MNQPTAGTITFTRGDRTETVPWNATGEEIHAALERLNQSEGPEDARTR